MSLTKRMIDEIEELTGMPVVYAYTDEMAVDDGTLLDVSGMGLTFEGKPINRMTMTLLYQEQARYPLTEAQLQEQFEQCGDGEEPFNFDFEAFCKVIAAQLPNAGGRDYLRTLPNDVWLVENELGGWTLLLSSDY